MDQIRVYELARELKISPQALISILRSLKVKVKSHMSYLEDDNVTKVKQMFQDQLDAAKARQKQRKNYQKEQRQKRLEKLKKLQDEGIESLIKVWRSSRMKSKDESDPPQKGEYAKAHFEMVNEKLAHSEPGGY